MSHRDEIIRRYEMLLEGSPEEGFALRKLLDILGTDKLLDEAIGRYRRKTTTRPRHYANHVILGHLLRAKKRYKAAIDAYKAAIRIKPRAAAAYLSIANTLLLQGKKEEALLQYEQAARMERDKSGRERIVRRAVTLALQMKRMGRAKQLFQRVIALDPRNVQLRIEYAELLAGAKLYKAALDEWKAIQRRFRGDPKTVVRTRVAIADLLGKLGRIDEAMRMYHKTLKTLPREHWLRRHIREKVIALYRQQGKIAQLITLTLKERKTFQVCRLLAALYEEAGDDTNAEKWWLAALKQNKRHTETHQALIKLYRRLNDKDKLFKAYKAFARLIPGNPKMELKLAELYYQYGEEKKALDLLSNLSKRYPRNVVLHAQLIDLYFQIGVTEPSVKARIEGEYKLLMRLEPKKLAHLIGLGEYYWAEGKQGEAERLWKRLLRIIPKKAEAFFRLAQLYADHKYSHQAETHFARAAQLEPAILRYRKGYAKALEGSRKHLSAIGEWQAVLRLTDKIKSQPARIRDATEARRQIVKLYHLEQRLPGQIKLYQSEFPPNRGAGYLLGQAHIKLKQFDDAERVYRKLLSLDAKDMTALLALQEIYVVRNKLSKAVAVLERIAEIDKLRAREIWQKIAVFLLNLNKTRDAEKYAKMAVDFDPTNAEANARLARVYWQLGKNREAIDAFKKAIHHNQRNFKYYFELSRIYQSEQRRKDELDLMQRVVKNASDAAQVLIAGRRAMVLNHSLRLLDQQEGLLLPLISGRTRQQVYRKLLIELYHFQVNAIVGEQPDHAKAKPRLDKVADQGMRFIKEALADPDLRIRSMAIDVLRHLRRAGTSPSLVRALEHKDLTTRFQAIIALGEIGDVAAITALKRQFKSTKYQLRRAAVWAMGRIHDPRAIEALTELLRSGYNDSYTRTLTILGLGNLAGAKAITTLISQLGDSRSQVREAAALMLGRLRARSAVTALMGRLSSEYYSTVKKKLVWALGQIRHPSSFVPLLNLLWSAQPTLREMAGWAVLQYGKPSAPVSKSDFDTLYRSFVSFQEGRIRIRLDHLNIGEEIIESDITAVVSVLRKRRAEIIAVLKEKLRSPDAKVRATVLNDLNSHDTRVSLGAVTEFMRGDRTVLAAELNRLGRGISAALLPLLSEKDVETRHKVTQLLGKIGEPRSLNLLAAQLRSDESVVVRKSIVRALARWRHPALDAMLPGLVSLRGVQFWDLRARVAEILPAVKGRAAVPLLQRLLNDPVHTVRLKALEALIKIGGSESNSVISLAMRGSDESLVIDIIETIAQRRLTAWLSDLRKLKTGARSQVIRESATMALKLLTH